MNRPLLLHTLLVRVRRYKLRTFVIGLGLTISVLATVLLQTAVVNVRKAFDVFISRMYPANGVVLMAGGGFMGGRNGRTSLRVTDVETVAATLNSTEWDPIVMIRPRDVRHGAKSESISIVGHSERAESVRGRSVDEGEYFSAADVRSRANVALIGATTAARLFQGDSPVGAQIFIDNVPFEVKGVLEKIGVDPHGGDQDHTVVIPWTTLTEKVAKINYVSGATFIIDDRNRAEAVRQEILDVMRPLHQVGAGQEDDFVVITPMAMNQMVNKSFRTFNLFIPAIVVTAFAISAGLILSLMQLSVRARRAELGLRMAVGARTRDVELQIILEVLIITAGAALIGVLLAWFGSGLVTPLLAAKFGVKELVPSVTVCILAGLAAMATGVIGAIVPARRAARLDPVQALR